MQFEKMLFPTLQVSSLKPDPGIYRLSHIKLHCIIGRRRITIQPSPSILVQFNM